jgi:preprotein translocase subunit SecG
VLISVILLQAGRGGGLTESFGGETAQSVFGTQAPLILKKATTASAVAFLVTSLALGVVTARRGRSLFEQGRLKVMPSAPRQGELPQAPQAPARTQEPVQQAAPVEAPEAK